MKPIAGMGWMEFVMSESKQERGVIPAGTRIKLYEGRVTLLEDVVVDADQGWIDKAIKDQEDYFNGINRCNQPSKGEYVTIHSPTDSVRVKRSKISD